MCGIAGIFGNGWTETQLEAMTAAQRHRGPDDTGVYVNDRQLMGLGHNRLSIIDLSTAGKQPMSNHNGRFWIVFNGEIYNYLELRAELGDYTYRSRTDTEVILAAYERWGTACVDHFIGMFAFLLWDEHEQRLFACRDRFGVKPLYYCWQANGTLLMASEIKALHQAGVEAERDPVSWATYLSKGLSDHSERTFWKGIRSLPPGHALIWNTGQIRVWRWYDLASRVGSECDNRPIKTVEEEYLALLTESVRLRFRSDVPIGINLSGGLDSSVLLGLIHAVQGPESDVKAYTFTTGDERYDELPWVQQMLARTRHPSVVRRLLAEEVPALAESVQAYQDEPFGGLPTLAYARLFERSRADGTVVLLDGQGMDEQWAGYDYYQSALDGNQAGLVQATKEKSARPECLTPEFQLLSDSFVPTKTSAGVLRDLQYRDIGYTKIPKSLRFNDRVSMRSSTELREPFLDYRLVELALRQPPERKIMRGTRKWLLRKLAQKLLPSSVAEAPKRPVQTPQREWLRGPLRCWADDLIEEALMSYGGTWLNASSIRSAWRSYCDGDGDNSAYVWQWLSLGLAIRGNKHFVPDARQPSLPPSRRILESHV